MKKVFLMVVCLCIFVLPACSKEKDEKIAQLEQKVRDLQALVSDQERLNMESLGRLAPNKYGVVIPAALVDSHLLLYSEKSQGLIFASPKEHRGVLRKIEKGELTLLGTLPIQEKQLLVVPYDNIIGYRLLPKPE